MFRRARLHPGGPVGSRFRLGQLRSLRHRRCRPRGPFSCAPERVPRSNEAPGVVGVSWQDMLPWMTSAMTLWAVCCRATTSGCPGGSAWRQALWLGFIVASGTWGLLPLTLSLSAMFASHLAGPPSSYLGVRLEPEGPKEEVAVRRRAHCGVATLAPALIALQGRGSSRKPAGDGGRRVRGALPRLRALGGKGYPAGVAGEAVPLAIRVVSVARDAELWSRPAKWPRPPMSSLGGGATPTTRSLAMRSWPTASTGWRRSVTIRATRCSMPSQGPVVTTGGADLDRALAEPPPPFRARVGRDQPAAFPTCSAAAEPVSPGPAAARARHRLRGSW